MLKKRLFGRYLFAIGGNPSAALLAGVPGDSIRILAFVCCGCMWALAGFLLLCRLGVADQSIGIGYEIDAIAAAVVGGVSIFGRTGIVLGVVVGTPLEAFPKRRRRGRDRRSEKFTIQSPTCSTFPDTA